MNDTQYNIVAIKLTCILISGKQQKDELIISTKLKLYTPLTISLPLCYFSSIFFHFSLFAFPLRSTLNLKHRIAARYTEINPERPAKTNSKSLRPSGKFHYFQKVTCCVFLIKQCRINVWRNHETYERPQICVYCLSIKN